MSTKDWDLRGNKRREVGDTQKKLLNPLHKRMLWKTSVYSFILCAFWVDRIAIASQIIILFLCKSVSVHLYWQSASKPGAIDLSSVVQACFLSRVFNLLYLWLIFVEKYLLCGKLVADCQNS